jgi:hypothetical protein
MAMLNDCEVYFVKCDPKHPNANFNKQNPTWEVQIRTSNPEQKTEWSEMKLSPKLMVYKEDAKNEAGEEVGGMPILTEDGKRQWRVNLKKKSITRDGEKASHVKVVDGYLEEIDPNTIGNGSVANIRIFQYEYTDAKGLPAVASVLMGMQVKKYIKYTPKPRDDEFEMMESMEVVEEEAAEEAPKKPAFKAPSAPKTPVKTADNHPDDAF